MAVEELITEEKTAEDNLATEPGNWEEDKELKEWVNENKFNPGYPFE